MGVGDLAAAVCTCKGRAYKFITLGQTTRKKSIVVIFGPSLQLLSLLLSPLLLFAKGGRRLFCFFL